MLSPAVLFAAFLAVTTLLLFGARHRHWKQQYYFWPALLLFPALTLVAGHFAWRHYQSLRELKALVDVPAYDKAVYVPTGSEIRSIATLLPANLPQNFPLSAEESRQLRNQLMSVNDRATYWILESSRTPEAIHAFYQDANHRRGWTIAEDSPAYLCLRRGNTSLSIFFVSDFPRPNTHIAYVLR